MHSFSILRCPPLHTRTTTTHILSACQLLFLTWHQQQRFYINICLILALPRCPLCPTRVLHKHIPKPALMRAHLQLQLVRPAASDEDATHARIGNHRQLNSSSSYCSLPVSLNQGYPSSFSKPRRSFTNPNAILIDSLLLCVSAHTPRVRPPPVLTLTRSSLPSFRYPIGILHPIFAPAPPNFAAGTFELLLPADASSFLCHIRPRPVPHQWSTLKSSSRQGVRYGTQPIGSRGLVAHRSEWWRQNILSVP